MVWTFVLYLRSTFCHFLSYFIYIYCLAKALISLALVLHKNIPLEQYLKQVKRMSGKMPKSLTIRLSKLYLDAMDRMIERGLYGSKSEMVREALRLFFEKHGDNLWTAPNGT